MPTQNPNHPRLHSILDCVMINTRTHVVFGGLRRYQRGPNRAYASAALSSADWVGSGVSAPVVAAAWPLCW